MALYTSGHARRSLIDTVAFRAVSQLATILGYVVMVRAMTKEDFGVFNLLYAFIPVVSTVASLGLEQTLRRYQPEYLQAGNTAGAAWLVRFVASARFGTNVVLLGLILLSWNHIAPIFDLTPYRAQFVLFCTLVLLHFQAGILQLSLASHMLHRYSVGSVALIAVVKIAVYGALAVLNRFTLENAIMADAAAFAVAYVFLHRAHRKYCVAGHRVRGFHPDPPDRRRMLRYGFFNNFNDAGTLLLNSKVDNFYIAALMDPLSVGVYAFYTRLNEMANNLLPVRLFGNVIQPMFFALPATEAARKIPQYFSFLVNLNLALQWPVLAFSIVYHEELVRVVFGGKFVEHSLLLPLIVGFAILSVISVPVTLVAQYEEKAEVILLSKLFGGYNVVALLILIPVAGVFGAAIASGSAQAMKNGFIWWHVRTQARWVNGRIALIAGAGLWGAVAVLCQVVREVVPESDLLNLGIGILVIGAGTLIHIRGPAVSPADREMLGTVLRGKEATIFRRVGLIGKPRTGV
jgi:O-antigen/teichoic acid export membrane protein